MAHMKCDCGIELHNNDGHIVYDVFEKKKLQECMKNKNKDIKFDDIYNEEFYRNNPYFWMCDNCKSVYLWTFIPMYCSRKYELVDVPYDLSIRKIKKLDEYYIFNCLDNIEDIQVKKILKKNPRRPYKYFVKKDLSKVYIVDTEFNDIDRIYDLTYESTMVYSHDYDIFDNILIYTIYKGPNEHVYQVENGKRIQLDTEDYPHKEVHFIVKKKDKYGNCVDANDPNKEIETYTINNMDEFNRKYGKYYSEKNKKEKH